MNADEWNKLSSEQKRVRFEELDRAGLVPEITLPAPAITPGEFARSMLGSAAIALIAIIFCLPFFALYRCEKARLDARPAPLEARAYASSSPVGMVPLRGHIMPNTRVFDGAGRYVGTITSVNPTKPNRSFTFRYADGTLTTKDWDAALGFGWYVES